MNYNCVRIWRYRVAITVLYMSMLFLSCNGNHLYHIHSDADSDPATVPVDPVQSRGDPAAEPPPTQLSQSAAQTSDVVSAPVGGHESDPRGETLVSVEHASVPIDAGDGHHGGASNSGGQHQDTHAVDGHLSTPVDAIAVHTDATAAVGEHSSDPGHGDIGNTAGHQAGPANTDQHSESVDREAGTTATGTVSSDGGHRAADNTDVHAATVTVGEHSDVDHVSVAHTDVADNNVATTGDGADTGSHTLAGDSTHEKSVEPTLTHSDSAVEQPVPHSGPVLEHTVADVDSVGKRTMPHSETTVVRTVPQNDPTGQPTSEHSNPHVEPTVAIAHTRVDNTHKDSIHDNAAATVNSVSTNENASGDKQQHTVINDDIDTMDAPNDVHSDVEAAAADKGNGGDDQGGNNDNPQDSNTQEEDDILDMFMGDVAHHRFPQAMSLDDFKLKVVGKRYKKLYIMETGDDKIFNMVRQLEVVYTLKDNTLFAHFLFRFIYSRKCHEVKEYRMGKLIGDKKFATFEKGTKDGKTERLVFFSDEPTSYVYLMSCTDMKTSPSACKDTYYLTLGSARDPPNHFPWLQAAHELRSKMGLSFDDPRFMFNFVMTPCPRKRN